MHGIESVEVLQTQQECGDTDGIWTREKNIPLSVVTADCAPILLAAKDGSFIAAIHAGWRGTVAHIVSAFFRRSGVNAAEIVAVIGPSIGPCCYEVSAEIITQFQSEFPGVPIEPTPRRLDFKIAIVSELQACGVPASQIDVLPYCTFCSPGFCSYRRDRASTRQVTVISRMDHRFGRE